LGFFQSPGGLSLEISDDDISIFIQHIALSSVSEALEARDSFIQVPIQVLAQAEAADAELIADVFVVMAPGFQIKGHHPSAHNWVPMLKTFLLELQDLLFREVDASHSMLLSLVHKGMDGTI
jgi:hypothetical protein